MEHGDLYSVDEQPHLEELEEPSALIETIGCVSDDIKVIDEFVPVEQESAKPKKKRALKKKANQDTTEQNDPSDQTEHTKQKRSKIQITPEIITNILKDRYHNGFTVHEIKKKYNIGHETYKTVNAFSAEFIERFGKKKKTVHIDTLIGYWNEQMNVSSIEKQD